MLNKEQIRAVEHLEGPALILAVPGAGKTTVLVHRIANLIEKYNVSPDKILSITFSRASANDMKERFYSQFPNINKKVEFSTIHSFCFFIVREYSYMIKRKLMLIEDTRNPINKYNILKSIYFDINGFQVTEDKLESLMNNIGYVKNMMINPNQLKNNDIVNFSRIYNSYESYKKENHLIDFDDMLSLSYEILRKYPSILNKYRTQYDFIQLDEGQDTSKIQMEIIKLIARPKNNLFIVADDDQSIYGFRGAYPDGLFQLKKEYSNLNIFFMEENFRSSKEIVYASNKFISNNSKRFKKNIFTKNDEYKPIRKVKCRSLADQYDHIIKDIKDNGQDDMAILYRNNISAIGIANHLKEASIDFYMKDRNLKFFKHWVIEDIFNFIRFSKDITNLQLYQEIYYKKKGFISKKQIDYAAKLNSNLSVFKRIKDYPGINRFYEKNLNRLELDFKKLSKLKPEDAIDFIVHNLEYGNYLIEFSKKFGYNYSNLDKTISSLKLISKSTDSLLDLEVKLNELENTCRESINNKNCITLSTMHSSKGLEFDSVYILDMIEGEMPSLQAIEDLQSGDFNSLEEERRLFYVAITRARYNLVLFYSDNNSDFENSSFLNYI